MCNVPAASNESVAEHAIALYFAVRRRVVRMHELTVQGRDWVERHTLKGEFGGCPGTAREEIAVILGAGELGESSLPSNPARLSRSIVEYEAKANLTQVI